MKRLCAFFFAALGSCVLQAAPKGEVFLVWDGVTRYINQQIADGAERGIVEQVETGASDKPQFSEYCVILKSDNAADEFSNLLNGVWGIEKKFTTDTCVGRGSSLN